MSAERILVVDDEQEITLVLRSGLTKHGYDVRVASEGEAALELFSAWTPDLVVTDLSMPNMNGLKLCQRLRAISSVPIIILSVKGDEATYYLRMQRYNNRPNYWPPPAIARARGEEVSGSRADARP